MNGINSLLFPQIQSTAEGALIISALDQMIFKSNASRVSIPESSLAIGHSDPAATLDVAVKPAK